MILPQILWLILMAIGLLGSLVDSRRSFILAGIGILVQTTLLAWGGFFAPLVAEVYKWIR